MNKIFFIITVLAIISKFANVLKPDNNNNLPSKSKLDKTRSDIFGSLNYNFNNNIRTNYFFSYDRDLKHSNLEQLNLEFLVNNIITGFSYYTEDNEIGNIENIKNNTNFKIDNENKISFEIAKNLRDDFTQFYDLIYTYETDCLSLNLNYNRSFYSDGNLEPNKSISFLGSREVELARNEVFKKLYEINEIKEPFNFLISG